MTDNGHDDVEWVGLHEAARRLNLTPQTIRRRLKRGEFEARQVPTRTGPAYQVRLASGPDSSDQASQQATLAGAGELVGLIRDLQAQLLVRTEAAAAWQARAEMLAGQLTDLREHVRALEAPKVEQTAPEPPTTVELATEPQARPWWRRAWRWVRV
jgi:hypothetical protein